MRLEAAKPAMTPRLRQSAHIVHIEPKNMGVNDMAGRGLYANIHAKRKRIEAGSGERMRRKGESGRPSAKDFRKSAKTAKR